MKFEEIRKILRDVSKSDTQGLEYHALEKHLKNKLYDSSLDNEDELFKHIERHSLEFLNRFTPYIEFFNPKFLELLGLIYGYYQVSRLLVFYQARNTYFRRTYQKVHPAKSADKLKPYLKDWRGILPTPQNYQELGLRRVALAMYYIIETSDDEFHVYQEWVADFCRHFYLDLDDLKYYVDNNPKFLAYFEVCQASLAVKALEVDVEVDVDVEVEAENDFVVDTEPLPRKIMRCFLLEDAECKYNLI